ncbi:hypothetical protein GCM10010116_60500 [Microbispora rosea subsp. aerata]|nr:hypothetical protein GCM10010116_60500 [Microbispora rosea subsp. aerata]GIH59054.1 hypothetical protein Mro02_59680 [Microbispora rosea subsp. aerata]GLJ87370.1 hypothetical protein GCM10017588_61150 [Microbispora rosea subsp. aerata]
MSALPLIITLVLALIVAVGYVMVLVGIRREDKAMCSGLTSKDASARLARHVTGLRVRNGGPNSRIAETRSLRPVPVVPTSPVRRCVAR